MQRREFLTLLTKGPAMPQILRQTGVILTDKGSKYAVSGCPVTTRAQIDAALKTLKRQKPYAKATHNTWGALLADGGGIKSDDGESGAGMVILRMLEREGLHELTAWRSDRLTEIAP